MVDVEFQRMDKKKKNLKVLDQALEEVKSEEYMYICVQKFCVYMFIYYKMYVYKYECV